MPDKNPTESEKPHPTPREGENVHERPEVKPLIEKARAEPERRIPHGTMKTGADTAGGGGTKSLEGRETETPAKSADDEDA